MAIRPVFGSDTVTGTSRSDTYILDPNTLIDARIIDTGGASDTLLAYDRPGRDSGQFYVEGTDLVWTDFEGAKVSIALTPSGGSRIEFLTWERLEEDGVPYVHQLRIFMPGESITSGNSAAVGTQGNDSIRAPDFADQVDGWSEVYGNKGNDTLIGSNNHAFYLYGGDDDDRISGSGGFGDYFWGDAGNDQVSGGGGQDGLYGGTGRDTLLGGVGGDTLEGGQGSDRLSGGTGSDVFHFNAMETGTDRITDYTANDELVFAGILISSVHARQSGNDVFIEIDGGGSILVLNVLLADVSMTFE